MTFETFDQRDEETWPDQQINNNNDKDIYIKPSESDPLTFDTLDQSDDLTKIDIDIDNDIFRTPERLVNFETLITFLTIENTNTNIHSDS